MDYQPNTISIRRRLQDEGTNPVSSQPSDYTNILQQNNISLNISDIRSSFRQLRQRNLQATTSTTTQYIHPNNQSYLTQQQWDIVKQSYNKDVMFGDKLRNRLGLPKDYERAFYWYSLAAKDGIAEAKSAMAYYFVRGLHGQQDDLAALHWYHEAAKGGHVDSMTAYGWMLMTGKGASVDIGEASYYLSLAAKNGDKQAAKFLKEIKMKRDERIQLSASPALKND